MLILNEYLQLMLNLSSILQGVSNLFQLVIHLQFWNPDICLVRQLHKNMEFIFKHDLSTHR